MQSLHEPQGGELLSARQVQLMLDIDRSTVYRMAEDGRLPAIKVGRQWRFPGDRVRALLQVGAASGAGQQPAAPEGQESSAGARRAAADPVARLDPAVLTPVTQVAADLLGVMMVVTDMDGHPLTAVANPCPWFAARSDDSGLLDRCVIEWQQLADDPDFEPRFAVGALGFECARAFVRRDSTLVGMVLAGGVAPAGDDVEGLYVLDADDRRRVLAALPKVAAALSQVGSRV